MAKVKDPAKKDSKESTIVIEKKWFLCVVPGLGIAASLITIVGFVLKMIGFFLPPGTVGMLATLAALCWIAVAIGKLRRTVKELTLIRKNIVNIQQYGIKNIAAASGQGDAISAEKSKVAKDQSTVDTHKTIQKDNIAGGDIAGGNIEK